MQTKSKIIIGFLSVALLGVSGSFAYSQGLLDSWFQERQQAEIEAKLNSFWGNDIHRFEFGDFKCVQNIKEAIPTPEKISNEATNYMLMTVTCLQNSSTPKTLKIDTPSRVLMANSIGDDVYYDVDKIDIGNNLTTSRHSFRVPSDEEYDFKFKITALEDFIDFGGEVVVTMHDKELTESKDIVTTFTNPDEKFNSEINIPTEFYVNNDSNKIQKTIEGNFKVTIKERTNTGLIAFKYSDFVTIKDYGTYFRVHKRDIFEGMKNYYDISNSDQEVEFQLMNNKLYMNDNEIGSIPGSSSGIMYFGGIPTFSRVNIGTGMQYVRSGHQQHVCTWLGYSSYNSYNSGGGSSNQWEFNGNTWYRGTYSGTYTYNIECSLSAQTNTNEMELLVGKQMTEPYMIDNNKIILLPGNYSDIKINLGDKIQTIEIQYDEIKNITSFEIPEEIKLKELERSKLQLMIGNAKTYLPYFYDPLRQHEIRWMHFENALKSYESQ